MFGVMKVLAGGCCCDRTTSMFSIASSRAVPLVVLRSARTIAIMANVVFAFVQRENDGPLVAMVLLGTYSYATSLPANVQRTDGLVSAANYAFSTGPTTES